MDRWRGKWALVTGASAGIGLEFARQLAAGGANLVLTARRRDRLEKIAQELASKHGIPLKLWRPTWSPRTRLHRFFSSPRRRIEMELLVNNAGFGVYGEFGRSDCAELEMVRVNCSAVVHLTHLYLPSMIARRHGDILIVASIAGFQGVPFFRSMPRPRDSTCFLRKVWRKKFVRTECTFARCARAQRIPSSTPWLELLGGRSRPRRPPEKVARVGLQAVAKGKSYVISGAKNYLLTQSQRLSPRSLVTKIAAKMYRPEH